MFSPDIKLEQLNSLNHQTMVENLGIEFVDIGDDFLKAKMPVDHRTIQQIGLLHGGASVALAETLGSVASTLLIDMTKEYPVGLEINANHVKSVKSGTVTGTCKPIHVGKGTHIWEIKIENEQTELICISRLTVAILRHKR